MFMMYNNDDTNQQAKLPINKINILIYVYI